VLEGPHRLPEFLGEVSSDLRLALLCRPFTAWQYLPVVRQSSPETKIIYDTVDLHFLRLRREAEVNQSADSSRDAKLHHDMELTLARAADATLVVSPAERDVLLHEDSSLKVHVVPNIHRHEHPGPPSPRGRDSIRCSFLICPIAMRLTGWSRTSFHSSATSFRPCPFSSSGANRRTILGNWRVTGSVYLVGFRTSPTSMREPVCSWRLCATALA